MKHKFRYNQLVIIKGDNFFTGSEGRIKDYKNNLELDECGKNSISIKYYEIQFFDSKITWVAEDLLELV